MNPTRPTTLFACLAIVAFAIGLVARPASTAAQETTFAPDSPTPSASPSGPVPATTAVAATPAATRRPFPRIIFVSPTPWKFGAGVPERDPDADTPEPSPSPKHRKPKVKPKKKPTPRPLSHATPRTLPYATPNPPKPTPTATPSPTPEPTAVPTPALRRRRTIAATAAPSPTVTVTAAPATDTPAPPLLPVDSGVTPIPTQPPTPRPLAANQPSIPDSLADPNVRGIIARPIRELSQIGWMQGTWTVSGVTNKEDGTTLPVEPTTYVFSPIMKSRWMFGADGRATDYIYLTFDPFARRWVALRFGSNPSYGMWVSERGWIGNRIDFITNFSYVNGRQYRRRLTIIHKDARTFGIYETEQTPDGSFIPDDAYEFKRV